MGLTLTGVAYENAMRLVVRKSCTAFQEHQHLL